MTPTAVASSDWSVSDAKRRMARAERRPDGGWHLHAPEPAGPSGTLLDRLGPEPGARPLIGFDFPIGLPAAYAARAKLTGFRAALAAFGTGVWKDVYTPTDTPTLHRPFYPAAARPKGSKTKAALLAGLGGGTDSLIFRNYDRPIGGASLFWLVGPNQVGKATIGGWRDVLTPALDRIQLWPFDGALDSLISRPGATVAEVYPALAYRRLGLTLGTAGAAKGDGEARRRCRAPIEAFVGGLGEVSMSAAAARAVADGFSSEDDFDAFVALVLMISVVLGQTPAGAPPDPMTATIEGWVLGFEAAPSRS